MKAERSACFLFLDMSYSKQSPEREEKYFFKFILSKIKTSNINVFLGNKIFLSNLILANCHRYLTFVFVLFCLLVSLACSACLFSLLVLLAFFGFFFGHSFSKDEFLKVINISEVESGFFLAKVKSCFLQITDLVEHYLCLWDHIWSRK